MDRELLIYPSYKRLGTRPPVTCRTIRFSQLPMGAKRHEIIKLMKENVGDCFVRMKNKSRFCCVDLLSHEHLLAVLNMNLRLFGANLKFKAVSQEDRWVNPKWVEMAAVVCLEE